MASIETAATHHDRRPPDSSRSPGARVSSRIWLATVVMLVASFMELMDVTIANVAVPSIRRDLGTSYGQAQWVVAGYALAFAVALMTGGDWATSGGGSGSS